MLNLSSDLKDLLGSLLAKQPDERLGFRSGAAEVKRHSWYKEVPRRNPYSLLLLLAGLAWTGLGWLAGSLADLARWPGSLAWLAGLARSPGSLAWPAPAGGLVRDQRV